MWAPVTAATSRLFAGPAADLVGGVDDQLPGQGAEALGDEAGPAALAP
jgi:hypothetical protein